MAQSGARRRLSIGLIAALSVNAVLLALMALGAREADRLAPSNPEVAVRVELMRERPRRDEAKAPPRVAAVSPTPPSPRPSTPASAPAPPRSPAPATAAPPVQPSRLPSPPSDQGGAKAQAVPTNGDADLRARTALALRKLGACSRTTSGTGDAQDKALCAQSFGGGDDASIDTVPGGKRAAYDAAHAKAGYLVPADAANPDFVVSQFKRGGTVVTGHAGCSLVGGKWTCVGH
jgi:hypothetical protein